MKGRHSRPFFVGVSLSFPFAPEHCRVKLSAPIGIALLLLAVAFAQAQPQPERPGVVVGEAAIKPFPLSAEALGNARANESLEGCHCRDQLRGGAIRGKGERAGAAPEFRAAG
jgi:hypothetical protein